MSDGVDFDPEQRVGYLLRRAYYRAKGNTTALLRELDITPTQAAALMTLRGRGPLSQAELGRTIGMEPANVHALVTRLRRAKLVVTAPQPGDARQLTVTLAERGTASIDQIAERTAQAAETTLERLEPRERAAFLALLRRIALD